MCPVRETGRCLHSQEKVTPIGGNYASNIPQTECWNAEAVVGRPRPIVLVKVTHTHSDRGLPGARLASDQHRSSSYVAIFDHLQNDPCCPARGQLADHPLGHLRGDRNHSLVGPTPTTALTTALKASKPKEDIILGYDTLNIGDNYLSWLQSIIQTKATDVRVGS